MEEESWGEAGKILCKDGVGRMGEEESLGGDVSAMAVSGV